MDSRPISYDRIPYDPYDITCCSHAPKQAILMISTTDYSSDTLSSHQSIILILFLFVFVFVCVCRRMQDVLREKGLPYYKKYEKAIGGQLFVWLESTFDATQFITNLSISHAKPRPLELELNQSEALLAEGYDVVKHKDFTMEMYFKREAGKTQGMVDLRVSFSADDEKLAFEEGYEMIDPCEHLSRFGVPGEGTLLWWKRNPKNSQTVATGRVATNLLLKEATKIKHMLMERPDDKVLLGIQEDLRQKIIQADQLEKEAKKESVVKRDPLNSAIELMALDETELRQWQDIFARMDKHRVGRITLKDIFEPLGEAYWTPFVVGLFNDMGALDFSYSKEGHVEFADYLNVVGAYCMFGETEVVKSLFVHTDKDHLGFITCEQYINLLNELFPYPFEKKVIMVWSGGVRRIPCDMKISFLPLTNPINHPFHHIQ